MPVQYERPVKGEWKPGMPIKALYVCDFCTNETITPNENWHRLISASRSVIIPEPSIILCNACKDHLQHRFDKKE